MHDLNLVPLLKGYKPLVWLEELVLSSTLAAVTADLGAQLDAWVRRSEL